MAGPKKGARNSVWCMRRFKGRDDIHLVDHRKGNSLDGFW